MIASNMGIKRIAPLLILPILWGGCEPPDTVKYLSSKDPELAPILEAMEEIHPASLGFEPIPETGIRLRVSNRKGGDYNATVDFGHTWIAFKKVKDRYKLAVQEESHDGPGIMQTPDGPTPEHLFISYATAPGWTPPNTMVILYSGEDSRLRGNRTLTMEDIRPVLREWENANRER